MGKAPPRKRTAGPRKPSDAAAKAPRKRTARSSRHASPHSGVVPLSLPAVISCVVIGALLCIALVGWIPAWLAMACLLLSALTFAVYWHDKRAAIAQRRRVPERTLQLLAAAGGWPGALLAQQWLRHKNRKPRFQLLFWLCVAVNVLVTYTVLRQR